MLSNGWAWLVCGRRLFVWNYKQTNNRLTSCYELQLPASDLANKASLVCLMFGTKSGIHQMPSVLAVSPEGSICFWSNVACETNCFETNAVELQGQECHLLTTIHTNGCILGTTTSSLMYITVHSSASSTLNAQPITCRLLKIPQGIFAGIKKFSNLLFGGLPSGQQSDSRSLIKILAGPPTEHGLHLYTFAGLSLQIWEVTSNTDRFVIEYDLDRTLREKFVHNVWGQEAITPDKLHLWIIDAIDTKEDQLVLLVAAASPSVSSHVYLALLSFGVEPGTLVNPCYAQQQRHTPTLENFTVLHDHRLPYTPNSPKFLQFNLLKQTEADALFYVFNNEKMICVQIGNDVVDSICFDSFDNEILGAGVCEGHPLVFTSKDALVQVRPNQVLLAPIQSETLEETDQDDSDHDRFAWIRKSFYLYRKNDTQRCQLMVRDNYHSNTPIESEELDALIVQLSSEVCDGIPAADPRWAESSTALANKQLISVYLSNQLEEKLHVHCQLIEFLKNVGVWDKLCVYSYDNRLIPTQLLLCEHVEKLVAANAFKRLHEEYGALLEAAIQIVLEKRKAPIPDNLTAQDIFYRELSKIGDIFPVLFDHECEYIGSSQVTPKETFEMIIAVSIIFTTVFHEVDRFRQEHASFYEARSLTAKYKDYVCWSSSTGNGGIRNVLLGQVDVLIKYGIEAKLRPGTASVDEVQIRSLVYQRLIDLTDIILDGYVSQLRSLDPSSERHKQVQQEFESDRSKCIKPLIKVGQYDRAISLAEKYEDFDTLVRVCEISGQNKRLDRYLIEFKENGFSDFLFKWYLREGKQGKMMAIGSPLLGNFLQNHPDLRWLFLINTGHFDESSECLLNLAQSEQRFVQRKKTLLSLSKLSMLADPKDDSSRFLQQINRQHELIGYQEQLMDGLGANSMDEQLQKPLLAEQLIERFISADWRAKDLQQLQESDFKSAFELTKFVDHDCHKYNDLRRRIIVALITQDK
jgi:nuclear pore complex protein Nup133